MPDYDLKTILRGWFVGNERFGERYGFLGKIVSGSYEVETGDGRVWVTLDEGTPIKAINKKVVRKPGIKVIVKPNRDGEMEIQGINTAQMLAATSNSAASIATLEGTGAHRHFIGSGNEDPVESRRFEPGLVHAHSGLVVYIEPFLYDYNGTEKRWPGGTIDLTSNRPATTDYYAWVKVGVNPVTNVAVATTGTEKPLRVLLTSTELDAINFDTSGYIPCGGVILQEGQTASPIEPDFAEARDFITKFDPARPPAIGGTTPAAGTFAPLTVDGQSDVVQLTVQAHSSQSANLQVWEDSSGVDLMTIANTGDITPGTDVLRSLGTSSKRFFDGYIRQLYGNAVGTYVKNTSGATANANHVGYIVYTASSGAEYKTTTTANLNASWCVVLVGGANNADILVATSGVVTVELNASCSAGDFLTTSTTAGRAAVNTLMRPEVFAIAQTANGSGAGGTCTARLYTGTKFVQATNSTNIYFVVGASTTAWTGTINGAPSATSVVVTTSTGALDSFTPSGTPLAQTRLWNTTRNTYRLVSSISGSTITTPSTSDAWADTDALTIESQTITTGTADKMMELDLSAMIPSIIPTTIRALGFVLFYTDSGAISANYSIRVHPYETFGATKSLTQGAQVSNVSNRILAPMNVISQVVGVNWNASGSATATPIYRLGGYWEAIP